MKFLGFFSYSFVFFPSCWTSTSTVKRESFFNCSLASLYFCWYSHSMWVIRCCKTFSVTSKSWLRKEETEIKDNDDKSIKIFVFTIPLLHIVVIVFWVKFLFVHVQAFFQAFHFTLNLQVAILWCLFSTDG